MSTKNHAMLVVIILCAFGSVGCVTPAVFQQFTPPTYGQARSIMPRERAVRPPTTVYRQYVLGTYYLQFDRIDKDNVMYGHFVTQKRRTPFVALHDGQNLYITMGVQEGLYLDHNANKAVPEGDIWEQSSVWKTYVDGRNITFTNAYLSCGYPQWRKYWLGKSYSSDGAQWAWNCASSVERGEPINAIYVATTDDTLAGEKVSLVKTDKGVEARLKKLKDLYDKGLINKETYERKKSAIISEL